MCRFVAYRGEPILLHHVLYEPAHSIIVQSYHARERIEPLNGDGFGFGWYEPEIRPEPGVFHSIRPAWSNRNLRSLSRMIRARHFFAHVRAASKGMEVGELNCHPFYWDRFLFMHNGLIEEFPRVRLRLRQILADEAFTIIRGTTDSEHLFGVFIDRWIQAGRPREPDAIRTCFLDMIGIAVDILGSLGVTVPSGLNLALTDGETIFVSRYSTGDRPPPSLYISAGVEAVRDNGSLRLARSRNGPGSVFIASERFSEDDTWGPIEPNHLITVAPDLTVTSEPIG